MTHKTLIDVTQRITQRSAPTRTAYLAAMHTMQDSPRRHALSCGNLAHGFAACSADDKTRLRETARNIGIITAYNDMLSAHQPYQHYPDIIKQAARDAGAVAQVAGGVPAMCDGVTQGQKGMELSLFSRDVIAMSTAIALSHQMFDAALCLGICDKIVPGLLMGALHFAHLPVAFVPSGPMPSGLPNKEKARIREAHAKGEVARDALLEAESASYHAPGTCTFYGTANSNQMLMEIMGLQLPGSSFVAPDCDLRHALTRHSVHTVLGNCPPLMDIVTEQSLVNAIIGLLATGGSTNHTLHLIAMARCAGIHIDWDDFAELSAVVPLLCRIYPNGEADVNDFHAAGGVPFIVRELLGAGLLHAEVTTILGAGLEHFTQFPRLENTALHWHPCPATSSRPDVVATVQYPFAPEGGLRLVKGNLGRAVVKVSALKPEHTSITAPARVFTSQDALQKAFTTGNLHGDMVAVVIGQGPKACGMPELHKLTTPLGVLQNMGFKVALLSDGRMSGASGSVLAAIHCWPEAKDGGALARLRDGDMICIDSTQGILHALVDDAVWRERIPTPVAADAHPWRSGVALFASARAGVSCAEDGASFIVDVNRNPKEYSS